MRRVWSFVLAAVVSATLVVRDANAELVHCTSKLCEHLVRMFPPEKRDNDAQVRRWERRDAIFYTSVGLTPDADKLFGEMLETLGRQAGLKFHRAAAGTNEAQFVRVLAASIENPTVQASFPRIASFVGNHAQTIMQAAMLAELRQAFVFYKPRYGYVRSPNSKPNPSGEGEIERCGLYLRAHQMQPADLGVVLAAEIYSCLTGFTKSNAVVSITNTRPTPALAPPHYLTDIDDALLRIVYTPGNALMGEAQDAVVRDVEARLRAEGFRDDGTRP